MMAIGTTTSTSTHSTRYVAALGGHLEVRAVFPEETVTLLREPAPARGL